MCMIATFSGLLVCVCVVRNNAIHMCTIHTYVCYDYHGKFCTHTVYIHIPINYVL